MSELKNIYGDIIKNSFYDEEYIMNPKMIDGKLHGVCIHFSRELIKKMKESGYNTRLISTLNDDGYAHAAVMYTDLQSGEILIADPVTDVKLYMNDNNIEKILEGNNYRRTLRDYYEQMGAITIYDDSQFESENVGQPKAIGLKLKNKNEIISVAKLKDLNKNTEHIQTLTRLEDVEKVADGGTLLACQLLYEKGIDTFCSNYAEGDYADIAIKYNSLSDENKEILKKLMIEKPQNYYIYDHRKVFGYPHLGNNNDEINEEIPMDICIGFENLAGTDKEECNLKMAELIKMFKKQEYRQGVYTRKEVLNNMHNKMKLDKIVNKQLKQCNATENDTEKDIAEKENLIYSKRYNMFFVNSTSMSRYVESLYREENDWRTGEEIAADNGILYENGLFTDKRIISPNEIALTQKTYGIGQRLMRFAKNIYDKIFEREK